MKPFRSAVLVSVFGAAAASRAHEGHGPGGDGHWHATDAWGFVVLALLLAVALWHGRGK